MPIIGISGSILIDQGGFSPGYTRVYVNHDYVRSVTRANGTPIVLPILESDEALKAQVDLLDGLILSGGHDVDPSFYNHEPIPSLQATFPKRDAYDLKLIALAKKKGIPILGICRGHQILNVYHGGTLHQDLNASGLKVIKHVQDSSHPTATHAIQILEASKLASFLDAKTVYVNSFHHQAIYTLAPPLIATATASDGIIEAFEHRDYPWLVGVQFHPEMMDDDNEIANALFNALIEAAQSNSK